MLKLAGVSWPLLAPDSDSGRLRLKAVNSGGTKPGLYFTGSGGETYGFGYDGSAAAVAVWCNGSIVARFFPNPTQELRLNTGANLSFASLAGVSKKADKVIGFDGSSTADPGGLELREMATPPAALANAGRVYCEDTGGGKTRLVVIFGSGAAQVLATEP